jgi:DNA polymerase I
MNRLVLIDGNAVLHRAYHAIPPLTAPDGSIVNAVYGFTAMLIRLFHDLTPTHIAVAFDRPRPTFRKKLFKAYQATRPKMDDALVGQIEKVHEMVRAFGIPVYEKDGFEADDVIGTLSQIVNRKSQIDQVIIVTGDRDILQLVVDDRVLVYMPTKGLSEAKLYHEADVKERLGVNPNRIADYKGLAGDASDNYPGIDGIGPKTAVSLLESFDTVDKLYTAFHKHDERFKKLSPSVFEKIKLGEKMAKLSKDLATIRTDAMLDGALPQAPITTLDTPEVEKILGDLHFHSLLKRLRGDIETYQSKTEHKKVKDDPKGEQQQLF